MGEGLGPSEVGKELAEHKKHTVGEETERPDRVITIIEAVLLAVVAVLAAYSGYASAKWGTESSLKLAKASATRTEASRANLIAQENKNFDGSTFNTWFTAYTNGNTGAMAIAEKRFRPEFRVAFEAWLKTDPANNPLAPPGPTYMAEYKQPELEQAAAFDREADTLYADGAVAGANSDGYVRTTVYLATVLFLIGIAAHFNVRAARICLIVVGFSILTLASWQLLTMPKPPG